MLNVIMLNVAMLSVVAPPESGMSKRLASLGWALSCLAQRSDLGLRIPRMKNTLAYFNAVMVTNSLTR
jgi:hypothetical protein